MGSIPQIPWPLTRIDRGDQLRGKELSLPLLTVHYGTFQVRSAGTDRIGRRKYSNRIGKQTDLGDVEIQLWKSLVVKLIEKSGEKALYNHLLAWTIKHNYVQQSKENLEEEAMELFVSRIFDNPLWVSFIPFNRKYRPAYLSTIDVVTVVNDCCGKPYQIPRERLEHVQGKDSCCEHCGRRTPFKVIGGNQ